MGIVGCGLLGTSLGLALNARNLADRVVGIGRRRESLEVALGRGAIDAMFVDPERLETLDLLVLCVPVDQIVPWGQKLAPYLSTSTIVTDVGSTKGSIVRALGTELVAGPTFVGSHPIAGSEKSGPAAGSADLFESKTCVVTPIDSTPPVALERVVSLWRAIGMRVSTMPPEAHDQVLARTSHLPHIVASALSDAISPQDHPFAGTGLRDATRLAAGDPGLWTAILLDNKAAALDAVARFRARLDELETRLSREDAAALEEILANGKRHRDALGS